MCTRRWIRRLCCGGHKHQSPLAGSCRRAGDVSIYQRCSSGPSQPSLQPTGQKYFCHLHAVVSITHTTHSVMHIYCNPLRLSLQMYCFAALSPSHSSLLLPCCSTVPICHEPSLTVAVQSSVICTTCMKVFMAGATTAQCDAEKQLSTNPVPAAAGHTCIKMLHQDDCPTVRSTTPNLPLPTFHFHSQTSNPNLPTPIFRSHSSFRCSRG